MKHDLTVPATIIAERTGLNFPEDKWSDLTQALAKAASSLGYDDPEPLLATIASGKLEQRELQALARHLTIPETHFFRSPATFAMLQKELLPEIIAARRSTTRKLRIWSAGCATGPEPYSLAILVSRLIPDLSDWDVSILATDINPAGFATARAGEYTQWAFRGTPEWVASSYFTKTRGGRYKLSPDIQEMVEFRYLNLVEDVFPSDCDLILCRNVIMYFARHTAVEVVDRLRLALRQGGYLLVTASETGRDIQGDLASLMLGGEIIYKRVPVEEKTSSASAPRTPVASTPKKTVRKPMARSPLSTGTNRGQTRRSVETGPRAQSTSSPRPERGALKLERRACSRGEQHVVVPDTTVNAKACAEEARSLADMGQLDQALERCDEALAGEKLNPSLYYLKASILQELGRPEEAEQALQSTLFLDDGFALARVMLGAIARSQARGNEAARHFREALALLEQLPSDSVLAETNGLTAGEMVETVASLIESEQVS